MSDRHQTLDDHQSSWTRLEYDASHWLEASDDKALRRFWIDDSLRLSFLQSRRI